jgi:uncharacterized Zn-binding protein involved in type VI secretion
MGQCAVSGALLQCSFGLAPATLNALPTSRVLIEGRPAAVVTSTAPNVNIPPFGMCTSLSNPSVAAATRAALGVLTPMPCIPAVVGPWVPGSATMKIGGQPALVSGSTCTCAWGGVVTMTMAGSFRTQAS